MKYEHIVSGIFLKRPNRFIAYVRIAGEETICHVKNTGRCRELLLPGVTVWCQKSRNPARKTQYDLIAVQKGTRLINMDAQAPNAAAYEWLKRGGLGEIQHLCPETVWGDSRFDFSFYRNEKSCLLEVKGVKRGTRHLRELSRSVSEGYDAWILFVIQMEDVTCMCPNESQDPKFTTALRQAALNGVQVLAMDCTVTPETMEIRNPVSVELTRDLTLWMP